MAPEENRWRDLLAASADAIIEFDRTGVVTWASPAVEELLGWVPDEIVGTRFRAVAPEDEATIAAISGEVRREHRPKARYRVRSLCRDGSQKWTDTVVRFRWSADGALESTVASIRDLSDLKAAEEKVSESDRRFRLAMSHSAIGMAIVAPDGRLLEVNPALCAMLGRDESDLLVASWQELTHPDDLDADEALVAAVIAGERDTYRLLKRYLRPDGSVVWGDLAVACVREDTGAVKYFISQIADVTDAVTSREALQQSEERYRLIAENSTDVIMRIRPEGVIEWISPSSVELLGRVPRELVGTRIVDLVAPDHREAFLAEVEAFTATGADSRLRFPIVRPDGITRWVESAGRRVTDPDSPPVRIVRLRDIDDEYRAGLELRSTRDSLTAVLNSQLDPHVALHARRDAEGRITDFVYAAANPAAFAYLQRGREEIIGRGVREVFGEGDASANMMTWCSAVIDTGEPFSLDDAVFVSAVSGTPRRFDLRVTAFAPESVSVTWRDVTERYEAQSRLEESERQYRLLADNSSDVVLRMTGSVIDWVSPSVTPALGWAPKDWIGHSFEDFTHPEDVPSVRIHRDDLAAGATRIIRLRVRHRDGTFHWVEVHAAPFTDHQGRSDGVIGSFRVIDDRVEAERALRFQARHDHLTGLLNRSEVERRLLRLQGDGADDRSQTFLAFADLDDLKEVNDAHGHEAGDELLRAVSERVTEALRTGDMVARMGGDEILIVLVGIRTTADAVAVMESVLKAVNTDHPFGDITLQPRISIGLTALARDEGLDTAISRADQAMYRAKLMGGNQIVLHEDLSPTP